METIFLVDVIGGEVERIPVGQLYFYHEEQESGPSPYIEATENGIIVGMGFILFLPFKK